MWRKLKDYVVIHVLSTHHDPLINTGMAEEIYDEEEEEACFAGEGTLHLLSSTCAIYIIQQSLSKEKNFAIISSKLN